MPKPGPPAPAGRPCDYTRAAFRAARPHEWFDYAGDRPLARVAARQVAAVAREVVTARKRLGWTQADLADRAQVSRNAVTELENGTVWPSAWLLASVAHVMGMHLDIHPTQLPGIPTDVGPAPAVPDPRSGR